MIGVKEIYLVIGQSELKGGEDGRYNNKGKGHGRSSEQTTSTPGIEHNF